MYTAGQLEQLWIQNGGNPSAAPVAAAVALAESSGNPAATNHNTNGSIDRGLWQINSVHGTQSTTDVVGNVKAAIAISNNGANWAPWRTYVSGAYKQFLGSVPNLNTLAAPGVDLSGVPGVGAASAISGVAGVAGINLPNPLTPIQAVANFLATLTNPATWWRILEGVLGLVLAYFALRQFSSAAGGHA